MNDYDRAKELGMTSGSGDCHHPMSIRLMRFLSDHDSEDHDDYFSWKTGGDGDNGEMLMDQMDVFFTLLDTRNGVEAPPPSHWPTKQDPCDCDSCMEHNEDPNYIECEDCRKDIFREEISINNVCRACHRDSWDEEFIPRGKNDEGMKR